MNNSINQKSWPWSNINQQQNTHKHGKNPGQGRVQYNSAFIIQCSNMEISKCPEIQIMHTNSINILQASQIYHHFSLNQCKQAKSKKHIFAHENEIPDFLQHGQPNQAIYSLLESARCKLLKAWHHLEKCVNRNFTTTEVQWWCSASLAFKAQNRWPLCLEMLDGEVLLTQGCLETNK